MGGVPVTKWDIFLAEVPFEDLPQSKVRPVLILDESAVLVICLKMTSQSPRRGEYVLQKWQEAGLHKPTTVRISKRMELERSAFIKRIGALQLSDIYEIQRLLSLS